MYGPFEIPGEMYRGRTQREKSYHGAGQDIHWYSLGNPVVSSYYTLEEMQREGPPYGPLTIESQVAFHTVQIWIRQGLMGHSEAIVYGCDADELKYLAEFHRQDTEDFRPDQVLALLGYWAEPYDIPKGTKLGTMLLRSKEEFTFEDVK